jgi:hypothetical protein
MEVGATASIDDQVPSIEGFAGFAALGSSGDDALFC